MHPSLSYTHTHTPTHTHKSKQDLPFWYPANVYQFINGSDIPPSEIQVLEGMIIGVNGTIPKSQYAEMLKMKHFNQTTPLDFHGYNIDEGYWPFWSSEPWTYASSMLALSQYRSLKASGQL